MCGGGLMQIIAYGGQDTFFGSDNITYGYSTTFNKKNRKFSGSRNFYVYVKNASKNTTTKSSRRNIKEIRGTIFDEYTGLKDDNRFIITNNSSQKYTKIFNSDKVSINKGIYFNNKRKYRNLELLFNYNKFDYYEYLSNSLDKIFKTNS